MLTSLLPILELVGTGLARILDHRSEALRTRLAEARIELDAQQLQLLGEALRQELQRYLLEHAREIDRDFRSFMLAYEGSSAQVHPLIQFLRGAIRPFLTLWAALLFSFFLFGPQEHLSRVAINLKAMPAEVWWIFLAIFGFWFGGRAVQHMVAQHAEGRTRQTREQHDGQLEIERLRQQRHAPPPPGEPMATPPAALHTHAAYPARSTPRYGPRR